MRRTFVAARRQYAEISDGPAFWRNGAMNGNLLFVRIRQFEFQAGFALVVRQAIPSILAA